MEEEKPKMELFPANYVLEGNDQHQKWFLCSLLSSVILRNKSPFMTIKTHGLLLDEARDKMSKSYPDTVVDPEDLLKGSEKLNG